MVDGLRGRRPVDLSCGTGHTLVVCEDGDVYSWGWNAKAQCGVATPAGGGDGAPAGGAAISSFQPIASRKSLKKSPDSAEADELGWRRIGFSEEKQESRRPDGAAAVEAIFSPGLACEPSNPDSSES